MKDNGRYLTISQDLGKMQIHPVALSLQINRFKVTAELAMRRKPFPKADTR